MLIKWPVNALPGAANFEGEPEVASRYQATPVFPLRPELCAYLPAQYLRGKCRFRVTEMGIECSLALPLRGGKRLTISHEFRTDEIIIIDQLPVVEIWPSFVSQSWHLYYTFSEFKGPLTFRPYYVQGNPPITFQETDERGQILREVSESPSFPEFLLVYLSSPTHGGNRDEEVGLLIPDLKSTPSQQETDFHIGVDFGTTNTTVYMRKGNDIPRPMDFRVSSHQITGSESNLRANSLYRYFYASEVEKPPFLSFFRIRPGGWSGGTIQPVREGHVFFFNEKYNWQELIDANDLSTRLKWGTDRKPVVLAYLKQLCVQCAAEAIMQGAGSLSWHYSLPTAFSQLVVGEFHSIWLLIRSVIEGIVDIPCQEPSRQTESVAVARYFAALEGPGKAFPAVGALFIDIGGGTSDISIWQDRKLLLQSSIRLSGREIFLHPLFQMRARILPLLKRDIIDDSSRLKMLSLSSEEKFAAAVDAILRTRGSEIRSWLAVAPEDLSFQRFTGHIVLALCGLFYYAGLMLRHLETRATNSYRAADMPSIHLCGNGSKLIQWVTSGSYIPQMPVARLLRRMLTEGAAWNVPSRGDFRIEISPQPKAEAAYGLVAEYLLGDVDLFDERAFQSIVAGEPFKAGQNRRTEVGLLDISELREGVVVEEIPSLRRFVEMYKQQNEQKEWSLEGLMNQEAMLSNALNGTREWCFRQQQRENWQIEVEPLFVIGLRELLSYF